MKLLSKLVVLLALFSLLPLGVSAATYEEGVHYSRLAAPQPTSTGDKVEVLEVFWYGCPHCFRFEPFVERWLRKKPANAEFVRMPGVLVGHWELFGRVFYTEQLMGILEKTHTPFFNALHMEKRNFSSEEAIADFFAGLGVNKDEFLKTFHSFAVETRIRQAKVMGERYGIDGVPAVIVNGKYLVSNRLTGGNAETLNVINYLVEKESAGK